MLLDLEAFSEEISASTGTGKEVAGLRKKKIENHEIACERIFTWTTEGAYEVFGNMYS